MSEYRRAAALALAAAWLVSLSACSTVSITVRGQFRPVMDLKTKNVTKLAVLPFDGTGGAGVSAQVQSALAEWCYYELVERKALQTVVDELARQRQAMFNSESAARIGQLVGASHVLIGNVTAYSAKEGSETQYETVTVQRGTIQQPFYNPDGSVYYIPMPNYVQEQQAYTFYTMSGSVAVSFSIVAVETGSILYSKNISRNTSGGQRTRAQLPTADGMLSELSQSVCNEFRELICPYSKEVTQTFLKPDSKVDASEEEVGRALQLIEAADFEGAEQALKRAVELDGDHAAACYDLAVLLALNARIEEAQPLMLKAVRLDPGNDTIAEGRRWLESLPR